MEDLQRERQRLAQLYAAMSDAELLRVADDPDSLTDAALDAIEDEAERRGLDIDLEKPDAAVAPAFSPLIVIRKFRDLPEAWLAKGALDAVGIESHLLDENMVRLDWFYSNAIGGIRLCVREPEAARAFEVLNHPPESFALEEDPGIADYQHPRCPQCRSRDVKVGGSNTAAAYVTMWAGVPIPLHTLRWKCNHCGQRWEEK
ncbi:MAG: hypothetical protein ACXVZT_10125 [Terriglobales bacterium]